MLPSAMRSYLVLDIETIPDPELPWDAAKQGFPPAPFHRVVALGVLWLDQDLRLRKMGVFGQAPGEEAGEPAPEATVLEEFAAFVGKAQPEIVTFNGRSFDMPVLVNRCLRHGVPFGAYFAHRDYRYRFSDKGHIDLAEVLTDHGASRRPSLDAVARLVGMPGKLDVDGSMVESMHEQGRIDEIQTYCLHDVVQTAFVFLRTQLLMGQVDPDAYRERAGALWAELEKDDRVRPVLEAADRDRVLLDGAIPTQEADD